MSREFEFKFKGHFYRVIITLLGPDDSLEFVMDSMEHVIMEQYKEASL